ncbi:TPA: restriction endonuclease subunit S [Vibrio parahaemolyticus]
MVPNGWKSTRLNKIAETVTSGSRDWAQYYSESGSKFIRMTNLPRDGIYLKLDDLKYVNVHSNSSDGKRTSLKEGDLLISITAELGKIGWVPPELGEAYINQHTALVRIKKESADSKYIAYLLSSHAMNHKINRLNDSGAKAGLNLPTIRSIPIVLPPLPEQRKVAKILSTWDKVITTTEMLIETSKQQKKALMQQLLTGKNRLVNPETGKAFEGEWEEVKLASSVSLMRSGLSRKLESENVGIAVLRSNNVGERYTSNEDLKYWYLDDPQGANVKNYILDEGDILVNFINSLSQIGKTCIYKKTGDLNAIYTTNLLRLKPNTEAVTGDFLFYLTKTERYRNAVKSITKPAVNQASFTTKEFGKITFTLPALKEQQKIASVLTAADKEIEVLQAKLAHFKQEKKALMQQLLTGKRRVKVDEEVAA